MLSRLLDLGVSGSGSSERGILNDGLFETFLEVLCDIRGDTDEGFLDTFFIVERIAPTVDGSDSRRVEGSDGGAVDSSMDGGSSSGGVHGAGRE